MRKLLYLLILCLAFNACRKKGCEVEYIYLRSYITHYVDGGLEVSSYVPDEKDFITIYLSFFKDYKLYYAPELDVVGGGSERFLEIAQRNGDRSYDREVMWDPSSGITCTADNFKSVQVICTNAAWDDKHPAGTSLNDLLRIQYRSYAHYIQSGYKEWEAEVVKPLSELKETDLTMIDAYVKALYIDVFPASGSYDLEVSLVTTEGVEKKATCTVKVK